MSDYRISDGASSVISGTGQIEITAGTTAITGNGTSFLTELHVGDLIIIGGVVIGSVATVSTGKAATLTYADVPGHSLTNYSIDPLVTIQSINADAIDPLGDYYRWVKTLPLGNGLERSLGHPHASWLWKNIGQNLRTGLLVYCPSKSAQVYIRTLTDPSLGTFATFQAAMLWPDTDNTYTPDFVIEFRDLIAL